MKKKIIALISGAVILIIAAGSIYGKSESGHKEGEPDVVGTFSVNRDENITVVANRGHIEDREAFARELLQMYKDDSFYSTKFSTDRGYATSLDMNIYLSITTLTGSRIAIIRGFFNFKSSRIQYSSIA